ncbi:MAG TPA: M48 family metallopeptidase [Stellaceae bacterium]
MTVTLAADGIAIAEPGAEAGEVWSYRAVSLRDDELREGPVRIAHGDARLTVEDPAFAAALMTAAPRLRRAARLILVCGTAATILLLAGAGGLWWWMPRIAARIAEHVPPAWEEKLAEQVETQPWWGPRCTGSAGQAALDALTRRLTEGVDIPYPLVVSVRDDRMVNAFALPGGHIVLLRGLLNEAQSPDEVAGVLGHELTHTLKRHPTRALIANSGLSLLFELTVGNGTGASLGLLLTTLSYTRTMEAEADDGAVALLERAGIGTEGFAAFFDRMAKHGHGPKLPYFNSHPPDEERLAAVRAHAVKGGRPAISETEWYALKAICDIKSQ